MKCGLAGGGSFVQKFGFEIILAMYYKLVMQCSVEECPNPPLAHGLCSLHTKIPLVHHHPISGNKNGGDVTMAGRFFHSLSMKQPQGEEKLEEVLPVVRVPFIRNEHGEHAFKYHNYRGDPDDRSFIRDLKKTKLKLREELVAGIHDANVLDRPIVFLVATNIPHTGIYILHGGKIYSVAYGYDTTPATGSLYSIDIPLIQFSEARIVWVGILTEAIVGRLQAEFDQVTHIMGNFKAAGQPRIVDRLMFFHTPRAYGGVDADSKPDEWNCTKWAMHVLFGERMPANFRSLVSRTNPGLTQEQLTLWLTAYGGHNQAEFIRVLNEINHASFPRVSRGGRRGRMTKRKTIKMRHGKTRRDRKHSRGR
jgi:hypothetical protein